MLFWSLFFSLLFVFHDYEFQWTRRLVVHSSLFPFNLERFQASCVCRAFFSILYFTSKGLRNLLLIHTGAISVCILNSLSELSENCTFLVVTILQFLKSSHEAHTSISSLFILRTLRRIMKSKSKIISSRRQKAFCGAGNVDQVRCTLPSYVNRRLCPSSVGNEK